MSTQMTSAAVLFGLGDVLAQQGVEQKGWRNHDVRQLCFPLARSSFIIFFKLLRTSRLAFYGGCIFAPIASRWYILLERIPFKSRPALIASKVCLDQFVLTPAIVGLFFTSMTILEGKGTYEIRRRLETTWQPTIIKNWTVFIPVQLLNFSVVPVQYRLLLVNFVSLFWNAYLSYANSKSQGK